MSAWLERGLVFGFYPMVSQAYFYFYECALLIFSYISIPVVSCANFYRVFELGRIEELRLVFCICPHCVPVVAVSEKQALFFWCVCPFYAGFDRILSSLSVGGGLKKWACAFVTA